MLKTKIILTIFALVTSTTLIKAEKTRFFFSVGSSTKLSNTTTSYGWESSLEDVQFEEGGSMKQSYKMPVNFTAGLEFPLNENLKISLSATYSKSNSKIDSSYILSGQWADGENFTTNLRQWSVDDSKITQIPVSLNLNYYLTLSPSVSMNFKAGATMMFMDIDFKSAVGFGEALSDANETVVDWFIVPTSINKSALAFGGNIGVELEKRLSLSTAVFVGLEYHMLQKKSFSWEVDDFDTIEGGEGFLELVEQPDIHGNNPIKADVKTSHLRFFIGLKFSL